MAKYAVKIRGKFTSDDGLEIDMGEIGQRSWWELPLPPCPDCGGDVVWWEAGYVPGTRRCIGAPIGGPVTNPILDRRVPVIGATEQEDDLRDGQRPLLPAWQRMRVLSLYAERRECPEGRVGEIDRELIAILEDSITREYPAEGGCGSLFSVQCRSGRAILRRERLF